MVYRKTGGSRRWVGLGVLAAGLSMIVLDGTIVGVALPRIIASLALSLSDAQWVTSLYSVVFAALLLTVGALGDRFGRRRLFVAGVVLFLLGSLGAAVAGSAATLIGARAVQGVGGAMILPSTLSTVNATFRGRERAVAFGVWGAVMAGMAALGPLLGGWLTTAFSWRWIFSVNIPFGLAIIVLAVFFVDESRSEHPVEGFDLPGLVTSALGLGLVIFGLIEGTSLGWWRPAAQFSVLGLSWPTTSLISLPAACLTAGVVLLGGFILIEAARARRGRAVVLDLSLFAMATFSWGNLTAAMIACGEFGLVFVLPLYLVNVLGLSILGSGVVLAAMAVGAFFSGASARHLSARVGSELAVIMGVALEVLGAAMTACVVWHQVSWGWVAVPMVVYGVGLGVASAQLTSVVLVDVPTDRSGTGSATQSTARQLGSAVGAAVAGTVLAERLDATLADALVAAGVPTESATQLAQAVIASAGNAISGMSGQGMDLLIGIMRDQFAHAASVSILFSAGFLMLGLMGSMKVKRSRDARARVKASPGVEPVAV